MKVHSLSVDSSQREDLNSNPNSYTILLKNPIYDVSEIKLVSARIPTPQLLICSTNNTFSVSGQTVSLTNGDYPSGASQLTSELQSRLAPSIDQVSFDINTKSFTFSNTNSEDFTFEFDSSLATPHQVLGFTSNLYTSTGGILRSGAINVNGPNSLILKVSSGSDEFIQSIHTSTPFYTGHLLLDGSDCINFYGNDDHVIHYFHSGAKEVIQKLKFEFFYMSHGKLIPYDFMNQDHVMKFDITCSTDKLENLLKMSNHEQPVNTPKEVEEAVSEDIYKWRVEYTYILGIVLFGIFILFLMKTKPRKISE